MDRRRWFKVSLFECCCVCQFSSMKMPSEKAQTELDTKLSIQITHAEDVSQKLFERRTVGRGPSD
jgi:hypothetical protein